MKSDLISYPSGRTIEELLDILSEVQFWGVAGPESSDVEMEQRPADSGQREEIS